MVSCVVSWSSSSMISNSGFGDPRSVAVAAAGGHESSCIPSARDLWPPESCGLSLGDGRHTDHSEGFGVAYEGEHDNELRALKGPDSINAARILDLGDILRRSCSVENDCECDSASLWSCSRRTELSPGLSPGDQYSGALPDGATENGNAGDVSPSRIFLTSGRVGIIPVRASADGDPHCEQNFALSDNS
jgi:hypothetical protein